MSARVTCVLPRMLQLAGEVGDGVVSYPLASPRYLRQGLRPRLAEGAKAARRDPTSVEVVVLLVCAVSKDREEARHLARHQLAFYATSTVYRPILERDGFGREWETIQQASLQGDLDGMVQGVSDEMLDAFAAAGTPEECRRKVADLGELADLVVLQGPTNGLAAEQIVEVHRSILDTFTH